MIQERDEVGNRPLEIDVVFPERVVGIDEKMLCSVALYSVPHDIMIPGLFRSQQPARGNQRFQWKDQAFTPSPAPCRLRSDTCAPPHAASDRISRNDRLGSCASRIPGRLYGPPQPPSTPGRCRKSIAS